MMAIFYEEALSLISELRTIIEKYSDSQTYNSDYIKMVFRVIHTMKADSTMMLIDAIAVPSRVLESLLAFFRNNKIEVTDKARFDKILITYMDYIAEDVDRFSKGEKPEEDHKDLEKDIKDYLEDLKKEYKKDIPDEKQEKVPVVKQRQVYYIASADTGSKDTEEKQEEKKPEKSVKIGNDPVVLVKQSDIDRVYRSIKHYKNFVKSIEERFGGDKRIEIRHRDLMMLKNISHEMSQSTDHLTKSDFVAIAQKMELLVDEMSVSLNKPVKLIVRGENTLFDKSSREKISSALVHIIRNAVDHGIESMEERERMGKAPVGLVRLSFKESDGHLVISVEDDGAGIDKKAVLKSAKENKVLKKPEEEYTEEEIINLLYSSGLSTTEKPNDYSGRGVGMDVIQHNITSLGGTIKISSNFGYGTKVVITL